MSSKGKTIEAKIGGSDLSSNEVKSCRVLEIILAEFNPYTFENDIALLKIGCEHQQVLQLANIMPVRNFDCLIYGYGSLSFETNSVPSNLLHYGVVQPISYKKCEKILGRVVAPPSYSGQFCARGVAPEFSDACNGMKKKLIFSIE